MKKFCSKCGSLLDLGKKNCTGCQAFNPYFISGFANTTPTETQEELMILKDQAVTSEAALRAQQLERERIEQGLKSELLKVKQETEQYKKETLNLVQGVQKELLHIDKENKLLKQTVQQLKSNKPVTDKATTPVNAPAFKNAGARLWYYYVITAAVVLSMAVLGLWYLHYGTGMGKTSAYLSPAPAPAITTPAPASPNKKSDTGNTTDTTHLHKWMAVTKPPVPGPSHVGFNLTPARVMGDLVGKKLSGCDITINSSSEINNIANIVLIEKLSASYFKYKCTVKIKQGTETYTASPYLYYSAEGSMIKVDGANCE